MRVKAPHESLTTGGVTQVVASAAQRAGLRPDPRAPSAPHRRDPDAQGASAAPGDRAGAAPPSGTARLIGQRQASPHTIAAYSDTIGMLLAFAAQRIGGPPSTLDIDDLDAPLIGAFLDRLEHERGNTVRTRNAWLAAIRSLFKYTALKHPEHPEHAATIQRVLRDPAQTLRPSVDQVLHRPRARRAAGRARQSQLDRAGDHAMLLLTAQTAVRAWTPERAEPPDDPLFATGTGRALTRDALEHRLAKHASAAATACTSIATKTITPQCCVTPPRCGCYTAVIALWLGHEQIQTTHIDLHVDLELKERALAPTAPPNIKPGRYQPPDRILAFLEAP